MDKTRRYYDKHLYIHISIYQGTLQLQMKSFSFASSSLILTQEQ